MPPLVSIIIPTFNSEAYLAKTFESVAAQTMGDWEAIVSDDGSTDGTVEMARDFARRDDRFKVIENPPAHHPGPTRNAGIANARGTYIAFLDSDDIWFPDKLEVQLEAIRKVANPGICYGLAEDFWDGPGEPPRGTYKNPPPPSREQQYAETLLRANHACTSTYLLERKFAEEIGPFTDDPDLAGTEDRDFTLRALWLRPFVFVPRALVRYRVHPESISQGQSKRWKRLFVIYDLVEKRGQMPPELRRACNSTAWWLRGEIEAGQGEAGWRGSFLKAFARDPLNWRRWPGLMALVVPRSLMHRFCESVKTYRRRRNLRAAAPVSDESG